MPDRRPVPLLIVLILVVLLIGGVVAGLVLAPPPNDLTVQNAAGENLLAPSLTVHITVKLSSSASPQTSTRSGAFVIDPTKTNVNKNTTSGAETVYIVDLLRRITTSSPWTADPNSYRYTGRIATLLGLNAAAQRAQAQTGISVQSAGAARTWVSSRFLSVLVVRLVLREGPVTVRESQFLAFTKIGDYRPPVSHLKT